MGHFPVIASPSFDDVLATMAAASAGDLAARVAVLDGPADDPASRIALALNALLNDRSARFDAAERSTRRLRTLAEAARAFSASAQEPDRVASTVARRLAEALHDQCVVRLISEDGRDLVSVAVHGVDEEAERLLLEVHSDPLPLDQHPIARRVHETGEPFIAPKLDVDALPSGSVPRFYEWARRIGLHSLLILPMRSRGHSFGQLVLMRYRPESPPFDEEDIGLATALADHAAIAIANSRSFAAEREARDRADKATARFLRLSEAGVIGTLVIDLADRRVVDVNDTLLQLVGCSRDEVLSGRVPWASLTPPEWNDVDTRAVEQLTTTGVARLREKEFLRRDGTRVPVMAASAMLGGTTTECISFVLDLTERKAAERGRRDAERRAQRMIDSAMVGIWTVAADGRTTFMNSRMANILGRELADALATPFADILPPEERPRGAELFEMRRRGVASSHEQKFCKPDGAVGVLWVEASPMYDAEGRYEGVLGIVTDITERRRTEEALRASEARYRLMFDQSPLPKWMYDAETLRILDVNEAAIRDFGYTRAELLSSTIKELRPAEDIPAFLEAERRADLLPKFGVWRLSKKGGDVMQVELTKHTFMLGDRVTRLVVGRDVTERLRLEEQLRQSQKMEAAGRLAGGVAHDFNNVLSVILGYATMLLDEMKPGEPMRDDVQEIHRAGQRAADLTRQLLMFSRQQVLAPKVLDLNDVLTSMDKMLQRILGADVDLVSLPTRPLGRVHVDPSSVEQVIMNLVVNARDAMPRGGKLTMETANVELDAAYAEAHLGVTPGRHVMLAVSDSGTGIEPSTLGRIFEPFFTTKESGKGTGLGLSTVFGIVKQSGGSVWVYSEVGKGTTFKVYLPRVDAAVDPPTEVEPRRSLRGSETILLVEDDDQLRRVVLSVLRQSGYHVIDARNAGEALLHSESHPGTIDLLLSDVVMPQMSGPALAERLASSRPDMKVLCMSGYTDDSIVRHGVLDAHFAFLQKPLTPESITTKVREVLDTER